MAITKKSLAQRYHEAIREELFSSSDPARVGYQQGRSGAYWEMLRESLSPQELAIITLLYGVTADTTDIAQACNTNVRVINNTLKRLMDYGLVEREPVIDDNGLHYVYRLK